MNSPKPYVGEGFLWRVEARLAHLTGRDRWPAIEVSTTSRHVPADLHSYDAFITFLPFGWTFKGKPYATMLRACYIKPEAMLHEHNTTILQYNPVHPGRVYYAPQQMLARAVVGTLTVLLAVAGVVVAITWIVGR